MRGCFLGISMYGVGNTLHARGCGTEVVTPNIQMMNSLSLGKVLENIGKESWKEDVGRVVWDITCLHVFSVICSTF